jgi:hypothetical protein
LAGSKSIACRIESPAIKLSVPTFTSWVPQAGIVGCEPGSGQGAFWLSRGTKTLGHGFMNLDFRAALTEVETGSGDGLDESAHDGRPVEVLTRFVAAACRGYGEPFVVARGEAKGGGVQACCLFKLQNDLLFLNAYVFIFALAAA